MNYKYLIMSWDKVIFSVFILFFLSNDIVASKSYARAGLWQKEIEAFKEQDRYDFPPDNSILFVGSSSFRGWRTLEKDFP
ncbi:hypothetical protein, partial [Desulfonatronum sp. SC1]|uniref:hypothetical protein n=1 Tax=Desulfonatronum sp. SC1 TaxID=2109626 RepID=UPI0018EE6D8A